MLRYVYWRTTETIPPLNQLENFIPGILLYLAELYNVGMLGLSLFVVAKPLPGRVSPPRPGRAAHRRRLRADLQRGHRRSSRRRLPPPRASTIPPDKMTIWLLDDGGTDQKCRSPKVEEGDRRAGAAGRLTALCADLGVNYLTRAKNEHAKAGNLNNGLAHSTGELVAVFDADHAPARDFLTETVGYFGENPKLFLVQTPHFFINPDPLERNLKTFDKMPSENEMFYGIIQRGLDKWDASFFCGSAAVLRREALKTTNGFSGVSITEDAETALELHSKGWDSVYVDKPLIAGLQPATFASFIGQRTRWAQGMMQILRFRFPPLKRGLTLPQRLCYMSSTLFWLFPIPRMIFLIAPLFYLFFGAEIFVASGGEFVAYTLMYMIVNLMMQNYLYGRFRWPWISELYELIQSVYLLPALISVLLNPRKPTFKVTAKDETLDRSYISELGGPFFIIFAVLLAGVGMTVWRIVTQPYDADVALVVGGWNILNLLMVGLRARRRLGAPQPAEHPPRHASPGAATSSMTARSCRGRSRTCRSAARASASSTRPPTRSGKTTRPPSASPRSRDIGADTLPLTVRSFVEDGNTMIIGCRFQPDSAVALPPDRRPDLRQLEAVERLPGVAARQHRHHPRHRSGSSSCRSTRASAAWPISCAGSARAREAEVPEPAGKPAP